MTQLDTATSARLALEVRAELAADERLDTSAMGVALTGDGAAFLSGVVRSPRDSRRAADLVSRVTGVRSVRNDLVIAPSEPPSDDGR
jgi:osmotically-inducible protein OsmY